MTDALEKVKEVTTNQVFVFDRPEGEVATVESLQQSYVLCPDHVRDGYLIQLLRNFREQTPKGSVIIFTNTCKYVKCQLIRDIFVVVINKQIN
jgi:ATP-dependent RNA helicase DDX49/DBP8